MCQNSLHVKAVGLHNEVGTQYWYKIKIKSPKSIVFIQMIIQLQISIYLYKYHKFLFVFIHIQIHVKATGFHNEAGIGYWERRRRNPKSAD